MVLTLALTLATAPPVHAHAGGPIDAIDVQKDRVIAKALGLETSVGLVWTDDQQDWRWICHEAITTADAVMTPRYALAQDTWLGVVRELRQARDGETALYWTQDGCSWNAAEGLEDHEIEAVALSADGQSAWAAGANEDRQNAVFRSEDAGRTFAPTALAEVEGTFTSVVSTPGATWAASVGWYGGQQLHRTRDGGETWSTLDVDIAGTSDNSDVSVSVVGIDPDDPDIAWFRVDEVTGDRLFRLDDDGALEEVFAPGAQITDVEITADGGVWVGVGGTAFAASEDGIAFTTVSNAPPGLGVRVVGEDVWLGTRFELLNVALMVGNPDAGFRDIFTFTDLDGPLACEEGTDVAEVCEPLWPVLLGNLGLLEDTGEGDTSDDDDDSAPLDRPPAPTGCACGGSEAAMWWPLVLLGGGARRLSRRRDPGDPGPTAR